MRNAFGVIALLQMASAVALVSPLHAQRVARYEVDPAASLVWWQIEPHYAHLWATTCPRDPDWRAGEGRSPEYASAGDLGLYEADVGDQRAPMFPRIAVSTVCQRAVSGWVEAGDTSSWGDARGAVVALADSLITGLHFRDRYARKMLFDTGKYPSIRFALDSLRQTVPGDTLQAVAFGTFELRGRPMDVAIPVLAWNESGGLRVMGQASFPAKSLVDHFRMSRMKLGLGVALRRWRTVHWGFDLVLRQSSGDAD